MIAICAVIHSLSGLASAQPSPAAAKSKLQVGLSSRKLDFGKVPAGTQSSPQVVTLTNKSSVEMSAPVVSVTGSGFSLGTNGCANSIAPANSCRVSVTFTPPSKGKFKQGLLTFTDTAARSPQKVKLIGVGLTGPSPAATSTATPTPTATTTATPTATTTGNSTPAATATSTATQDASATPTATATGTAMATPSVTLTGVESVTATSTKTVTPTAITPTATATVTPSPTATPTLTATLTLTPTPTATSTAVFNVVFVTSTTFDGDLGGQAGADADCASLAAAANLPSGTYRAWLSTSSLDAVAKLGSARGFVRPDGEPFADQVSSIAAGIILNPLNLDESGVDVGRQSVWTGTTDAGTVNNSASCADWTIGTGISFGEQGVSTGGASAWSDDAVETGCNSPAHIYCFDTSHVSTLSVTPASGRIAFVSEGSFATSQGMPSADALCQSEAAAAGLANSTQFLALLATSTASAASRFDMSAMSPPYVRPDGIEIADAPTLAAGITLNSGIWQHADGGYVTEFAASVWTGSTSPNVVGTPATTCQNWSTTFGADTGSEGVSNVTDTWWNSGASASCAASLPVYCLEQ